MDKSRIGKGAETTDPRMSFASAVLLHVCSCYLFLVSGMV